MVSKLEELVAFRAFGVALNSAVDCAGFDDRDVITRSAFCSGSSFCLGSSIFRLSRWVPNASLPVVFRVVFQESNPKCHLNVFTHCQSLRYILVESGAIATDVISSRPRTLHCALDERHLVTGHHLRMAICLLNAPF